MRRPEREEAITAPKHQSACQQVQAVREQAPLAVSHPRLVHPYLDMVVLKEWKKVLYAEKKTLKAPGSLCRGV